MKIVYKNIFQPKKNESVCWPLFIIGYFVLRQIFGLEYIVIWGFVLTLIFLGISFERITLIFFIIALIVYLSGLDVEANHYFSFVYGFLVLSLLRHFYLIIKKRFFE